MAQVKLNDRIKLRRLKSIKLQVGWFDTGLHPGYPGRPSKVTVAQVARFNLGARDYSEGLTKVIRSSDFRKSLKHDIENIIKQRSYFYQSSHLLLSALINSIRQGSYSPNTPAWLAFKAKHNLNLTPLMASYVMLNMIKTKVSRND
jgi:hypothetical protein